MKKFLEIILLISICSGLSFAQTPNETAVANAIEHMRLAMLNSNKVELEKIGAENLSYGHSSGKIENNAEFIETIVSGRSTFITLAFQDQTISFDLDHGDTAIVRHRMIAKTNDLGKQPGEVNIGVILVWKKQAEQWKLLARQAYKLK